MGVYCINAARYLFGAEPTKVLALSASNREPRFQKVDEMMSAILHFPDECLASFTCSFGAADISRYTVVGTKGVMTSDPRLRICNGYRAGDHCREERNPKESLPSGTSLPRKSSISQIAFGKTGHRNPLGLRGWRMCESCAPSTNQPAAEKQSRCRRFPPKKKPSIVQEIHRPAHGKPQTVNAQSPTRESA